MGIRIGTWNIVYESVTSTPIDPSVCFTEKQVKKYIRNNPLPKDDDTYSEEQLMNDLESEGFWVVPEDITDEWSKYICGMAYELTMIESR